MIRGDKCGRKKDGRWDRRWGWVVTGASFMILLFTSGIIFSFGLILSELVTVLQESSSKMAWIFSIMNGFSMLSGPLASALSNRFGHRAVIITGSLLGSAGLISSSFAFSASPDMLFVTVGLVCGISFGLAKTPAIVAVGLYFDEQRALATGIAICGLGGGTFVFAPLIAWLLETYALQGTFLILGIVYANCAAFGALFRPVGQIHPLPKPETSDMLLEPGLDKDDSNKEQDKQSEVFNWSLLKSPSMIVLCLSSIIQSLGWFVPYMYLSAHAVQMGLSKEEAALLISILGISTTFGRVMYGWLSDMPKVSVLAINNASLTLTGLLYVLCPFFPSYEWLISYSVFLGLFGIAGTMGTRPILIGQLVGVENINDGFGIVMLCNGVGNLISVPLAGLLYDIFGDYKLSFYIAGSFVLVSAILCYPLNWINNYEKRRT